MTIYTLFLALLPVGETGEPGVLDVCSALRERMPLNGQVVAIRGIVDGGHGAWLSPLKPCEHPVESSGVSWPDLIYVRYPDSRCVEGRDCATFGPDWSSIAAANRYAKKMRFTESRDVQVVTYIGKFVTHADLGVLGAIKPSGTPPPELGYGPLAAAPAQLLLKSIRAT